VICFCCGVTTPHELRSVKLIPPGGSFFDPTTNLAP